MPVGTLFITVNKSKQKQLLEISESVIVKTKNVKLILCSFHRQAMLKRCSDVHQRIF